MQRSWSYSSTTQRLLFFVICKQSFRGRKVQMVAGDILLHRLWHEIVCRPPNQVGGLSSFVHSAVDASGWSSLCP